MNRVRACDVRQLSATSLQGPTNHRLGVAAVTSPQLPTIFACEIAGRSQGTLVELLTELLVVIGG